MLSPGGFVIQKRGEMMGFESAIVGVVPLLAFVLALVEWVKRLGVVPSSWYPVVSMETTGYQLDGTTPSLFTHSTKARTNANRGTTPTIADSKPIISPLF